MNKVQNNLECDKYLRNKRVALGKGIKNKSKVYLDTKYWLLFRDVKLKRNSSIDIINLLTFLERAVTQGSLICPFNSEIFFEISKQTDRETVMATVKLIDNLSLGVSLVPSLERFDQELFHFVESNRKTGNPLNMLNELVWTKITYSLGSWSPDLRELPTGTSIEKSSADYLWDMSFSSFLLHLDYDLTKLRSIVYRNTTELTKTWNEGKLSNLDKHSSYMSIFLTEVIGLLDSRIDIMTSLIGFIFERDTEQTLSNIERDDCTAGKELAKIIYEGFKSDKIGTQLPSIRVEAALHAAFRWDPHRRYKDNDQMDIKHAVAAIPYYDFFLTEKSLNHLIKDNNCGFINHFNCKTASDPREALNLIEASLTEVSGLK